MQDGLKLKIIFPITTKLDDGSEESEADEIQKIQAGLQNGDEYETEFGIYDIVLNPIIHLNPKCFIPKGKDQKKYYTQIVFQSEHVVCADGKPEKVYGIIQEYLKEEKV